MICVRIPFRLVNRIEHKSYPKSSHNTYTQVSVRYRYEDEPCAELKAWMIDHPQFEFRTVTRDFEMTGRSAPDQFFVDCPTDEDAVLFRLRWEIV